MVRPLPDRRPTTKTDIVEIDGTIYTIAIIYILLSLPFILSTIKSIII